MLFTNRDYTKHQDIHDQEFFRKSGFLYSALIVQSNFLCILNVWLVTASEIEISCFLNRNKKSKIFFEFINLVWSPIFVNSNRCILEVQQDR